jgi:hypothetical protein
MDRLAHRGVLTQVRELSTIGVSWGIADQTTGRAHGGLDPEAHLTVDFTGPAHVDARNTQHHLEHADRIHRQGASSPEG